MLSDVPKRLPKIIHMYEAYPNIVKYVEKLLTDDQIVHGDVFYHHNEMRPTILSDASFVVDFSQMCITRIADDLEIAIPSSVNDYVVNKLNVSVVEYFRDVLVDDQSHLINYYAMNQQCQKDGRRFIIDDNGNSIDVGDEYNAYSALYGRYNRPGMDPRGGNGIVDAFKKAANGLVQNVFKGKPENDPGAMQAAATQINQLMHGRNGNAAPALAPSAKELGELAKDAVKVATVTRAAAVKVPTPAMVNLESASRHTANSLTAAAKATRVSESMPKSARASADAAAAVAVATAAAEDLHAVSEAVVATSSTAADRAKLMNRMGDMMPPVHARVATSDAKFYTPATRPPAATGDVWPCDNDYNRMIVDAMREDKKTASDNIRLRLEIPFKDPFVAKVFRDTGLATMKKQDIEITIGASNTDQHMMRFGSENGHRGFPKSVYITFKNDTRVEQTYIVCAIKDFADFDAVRASVSAAIREHMNDAPPARPASVRPLSRPLSQQQPAMVRPASVRPPPRSPFGTSQDDPFSTPFSSIPGRNNYPQPAGNTPPMPGIGQPTPPLSFSGLAARRQPTPATALNGSRAARNGATPSNMADTVKNIAARKDMVESLKNMAAVTLKKPTPKGPAGGDWYY
ncbi:hypothetical protein FOA52_004165 [Chlamydomonas sp. UWO 241]|nr:hypothetical protein FOA52_004165 [Chlamydomonas sp. UWO 241]